MKKSIDMLPKPKPTFALREGVIPLSHVTNGGRVPDQKETLFTGKRDSTSMTELISCSFPINWLSRVSTISYEI